MLPNLSTLRLTDAPETKKRAAFTANGDDASNKRSKETYFPLADQDWLRLINTTRKNKTPAFFIVVAPAIESTNSSNSSNSYQTAEDSHEATFTIYNNYMELVAKTEIKPCVEITFATEDKKPDNPVNVHIDKLFYKIDDLSSCLASPDASASGTGRFVLDTVDVIASQLQIPITLTDAAKLRNNQRPMDAVSDWITVSLALKRGYGYYEGRGFISDIISDIAADSYIITAHVMNIELYWTHLVATTPLSELVAKMINFYDVVLQNVMFVPDIYKTNIEEFKRELLQTKDGQIEDTKTEMKYVTLSMIEYGLDPSKWSLRTLSQNISTLDAQRAMDTYWKYRNPSSKMKKYPGVNETLEIIFKQCWIRVSPNHTEFIIKNDATSNKSRSPSAIRTNIRYWNMERGSQRGVCTVASNPTEHHKTPQFSPLAVEPSPQPAPNPLSPPLSPTRAPFVSRYGGNCDVLLFWSSGINYQASF